MYCIKFVKQNAMRQELFPKIEYKTFDNACDARNYLLDNGYRYDIVSSSSKPIEVPTIFWNGNSNTQALIFEMK